MFFVAGFGTPLPCFFETSVTFFPDGFLSSMEHVVWRDVSDGTVESSGVIVGDESVHAAFGVLQRQWREGTDTLALDGPVIAFDLAVALRVIGAGADMFHAAEADEVFEVSGDELRSVIGDDSGVCVGVFFTCCLEDDFDIHFFHFFTDIPMHNAAAVAIQHGRHKVECA